MKRYTKQLAMGIFVLALLVPNILWAQEEGVTLEGLAERIFSLTNRVVVIEEQLAKGALVDSEGRCIVMQDDRSIHPESATKYWDTYGILPDDIRLDLVYFDTATGLTGFVIQESPQYIGRFRYVTEFWDGCEYVKSSDWWPIPEE